MPFTVTMPKLSPTMEEGSIAKWHKKEGEFVKAGELLLEIATDKATIEYNALDSGWLRKIVAKEGTTVKMNQPIALFTEEKNDNIESYQTETPQKEKASIPTPPKETKEKTPSSQPAVGMVQPHHQPEAPLKGYAFEETSPDSTHIPSSPLARRLAKEKGLDITTTKGSGPGGRITSKDLEMAQPEGLVTFGRREIPKIAPGTYEETPLTPIRKVIGKRLQESKTFIPHFYVKQVINAEPIVNLREQLIHYHLKVSFNDLIVRATALALRKHPEINTGFNSVEQTMIHFKTIDISVAVTLEAGLITPIIRHADYKNLGQISSEIRLLADKARKGKLKESEYKGGSFTISNLGMFGINEFTAVINPPQAAILAVGGIIDEPIVNEGKVIAGKTLTLVLSSDHRVIDGTQAALFLKSLQQILENPVALTL